MNALAGDGPLRAVLWAPVLRAPLQVGLAQVPGLALTTVERADELPAALPGAVLLIMPGVVNWSAEVATLVRRHGDALRWIQLMSAGYEGLEAHGVPPGVIVSGAGGYLSPVVAEHAIALLLAAVRQFPAMAAAQWQHRWDRAMAARMGSLEGRRLAIVGYGGIGREVARRARAFGMHVTGVSRSGRPDAPGEAFAHEVRPTGELHAVLRACDAVVLALPGGADTRHAFGPAELACLRPHVVLANVGRGETLDQTALCAALIEGRIAGAGLDVTDPEPLPPHDPLWNAPNLLIAPHTGGAGSPQGVRRLVAVIAGNVARVRSGSPPAGLLRLPAMKD